MIAFVAAAGVIAAAIATVTAERSLAIWILVAVLAFLGVSLVIIGIELVRLPNTQVAVTERGLTGPLTPDLPWRDIVRVSCSWRMNMGQRRVFVVITADAFRRLNSTKPAWLRAWHRIASHGASTHRVTWLYRPTDPAEDIVDFLTAELTARTRLSAHHEAHPGAIQGFTPSAEGSFTDHVDGNPVPADDPGIATCPRVRSLPVKITDVKPFVVYAPERGRNFTFVKVYTDEGLTGLGESGINGKEESVSGLIETYRRVLIGMDPSRIEHIWQTLWRGQFFRGGHIHAATVAAIDMALWDLRGKALGVPVYDLLGGKTRDYARCYCHVQQRRASGQGGVDSIDAMVEYAKERVAEGWQFVRYGAGEGSSGEREGVYEQARAMAWTVDAFTALREGLGSEIEICVDFHQRTTPTYAIQIAKALEPMRPFFIEDPLRAENASLFGYLRQHISAPIATGEQLSSKWDWQVLIEQDLMDYCRIDLCICGGLTEAKKVAGWCETHYIEQAPHNPLGPVSTAACLHFDLSTPLFAVQELVWRPDVIPNIVQTDMRLEGGNLYSGGQPGLGVELDDEAALAHPFQPQGLRILQREDGSVSDW